MCCDNTLESKLRTLLNPLTKGENHVILISDRKPHMFLTLSIVIFKFMSKSTPLLDTFEEFTFPY